MPTRCAAIRNIVFAVATAALVLGVSVGAAEAKHKHHHIGIVLNVGEPLGYVRSGYGPPCWRLKEKAIYTGSRYWWKRYYNCILY